MGLLLEDDFRATVLPIVHRKPSSLEVTPDSLSGPPSSTVLHGAAPTGLEHKVATFELWFWGDCDFLWHHKNEVRMWRLVGRVWQAPCSVLPLKQTADTGKRTRENLGHGVERLWGHCAMEHQTARHECGQGTNTRRVAVLHCTNVVLHL